MVRKPRNPIDVRLTIPESVLEEIRKERCFSPDGRTVEMILLRWDKQPMQFKAQLRGSGPTQENEDNNGSE